MKKNKNAKDSTKLITVIGVTILWSSDKIFAKKMQNLGTVRVFALWKTARVWLLLGFINTRERKKKILVSNLIKIKVTGLLEDWGRTKQRKWNIYPLDS